MDPRGAGESSTDWSEYSDRAVASDMVALVRQLGGPAVLMGNSFSAASAVIAATDHPDLVAGLVLIGPFVRPVDMPIWMGWVFRAMLAPPWGRRAWTWYYRSRMYPGSPPGDLDSYVAALSATLAEPGRMAAFRALADDDHAESGSRLDAVEVPVLVIMGTADPDFPDPRGEARELGARLPATVELIEGAGHYPQVEYPDRVARIVLDFLERTHSSS
jgi:pimeloyl-ACP methyl ester carboxylesterase